MEERSRQCQVEHVIGFELTFVCVRFIIRSWRQQVQCRNGDSWAGGERLNTSRCKWPVAHIINDRMTSTIFVMTFVTTHLFERPLLCPVWQSFGLGRQALFVERDGHTEKECEIAISDGGLFGVDVSTLGQSHFLGRQLVSNEDFKGATAENVNDHLLVSTDSAVAQAIDNIADVTGRVDQRDRVHHFVPEFREGPPSG